MNKEGQKIIALITFPGIVLHELSHLFFCKLFGIRVVDVCYFRFSETPGHVVYKAPENPWHNLLITTGPFIINSLLCAIIGMSAAVNRLYNNASVIDYAFLWLSVSIGMHAFPSGVDAKNLWQTVVNKNTPVLFKAIAGPIAIIFYSNFTYMGIVTIIYGIAMPYVLFSIIIHFYKIMS